MLSKLRELWKDGDFRKVVCLFIIAKIFVIAIAVSIQFIVPAEITHTQKISDNVFLNPFAQYDSTAYLDIAKNGYNGQFADGVGNYHWYPLYPLLIRIFSFIGFDLAAFLIANIASILAVMVLYLLVRDELGKRNAYKTAFYTLLFPTAYYFTMMYTESLFLLLSLCTFYFAKKGNFLAAGVFGFLTSLTRIQGILLFVPVVIIYLRSVGFEYRKHFSITNIRKIKPNSLFLLLIPAGFLAFMLYDLLAFGDAFIQLKSASVFGRHLTPPWEGFVHAINAMVNDTTLINLSYHIYNLFITISFIGLIYVCWKKLKPEYTAYYLLTMIVLLLGPNLFGMSRYMLIVFPAFMALSTIDQKNKLIRYGIPVLYAAFVLLMAGFILLHVTQRISTPFFYTPLF
ncbi:MAG: glycosyltransferase family 39 protein [Candidatus Aenigmarchaeota archaeon]|nr:glycosyltransferase family 39 protein [Candidatus Aenigmarchaeota archaeon]